MSRDNAFIPDDYDQLYDHYVIGEGGGDSLIHMLIRHFVRHATEDERETLAQDVVLRCIEKDVLKLFDPMKANFGGMIFVVARTVCLRFLDRKGREPLTGLYGGTLQDRSRDEDDFEPGVWNLDQLFLSTDQSAVEEEIDVRRFRVKLQNYLEMVKNRAMNRRDRELPRLVELAELGMSPQEMAKELKVTVSTIHNWREYLKKEMTVS